MTPLDQHYTDPRLVPLYDLENAPGADTDFYVALAADLDAQTIIDLGCGTGQLTLALLAPHRRVIGVDPSPAMLAVARAKAGADRVQWITGDTSALGAPGADLIIMTGNVAQIFLDDAEWDAALGHIHAALRPGGHLAFESRNPLDRSWERWTPDATRAEYESSLGSVTCWLEVTDVADGCVQMVGHNLFHDTGEDVLSHSTLRFRSRNELVASLTRAGFAVDHAYGGWHREPFRSTSRTMVFVARRLGA